MAAPCKRLFPAVSLLVLLAFHTTPSFASEEIVFGPRELKVSWLRLHASLHTFPVAEPGEATLTLFKKTPEKGIEGGFVLLNNQLLGLHDFLQGEDLGTERGVSLRSTNFLIVFLRGAPGATLIERVPVRHPTADNHLYAHCYRPRRHHNQARYHRSQDSTPYGHAQRRS